MSRNTTARRVALFSSSSLGLAAIVSAASLGAALVPATAAAQSATCASGTAVNNNGTANVTIAGGNPNNPGITCVYTGDTATVTTLGSMTVSTVAPGGGINLTAAGADDINWVSTAGTITGGAQTNGPVIEAETAGAGNITLTTARVTPNATSGSDGIVARSLGAGSIVITTDAVGFGGVAGSAAIEAVSNGGAISITTDGLIGTSAGGNNAAALLLNSTNRDGIVAMTTGAGAVTLDINDDVVGHGPDGAAVRITNGTGDVVIDAAGTIQGGNTRNASSVHQASAIVIDSQGDIAISSTRSIMGGLHGEGPLSPAIVASGETFILNMRGDPALGAGDLGGYVGLGAFIGAQGFSHGPDAYTPSAFTFSDKFHIGGNVDLSGVTGGAELNFETRSRWMLEGPSLMSPGDDVVRFDPMSVLMTTFALPFQGGYPEALIDDVDQTLIAPGVLDFGAGADTFNNDGMLLIGPGFAQEGGIGTAPDLPPLRPVRFGIRGEVRLLNLEQFNNSGAIWLGPTIFGRQGIFRTDGWRDDMLYVPGATFHGAEGSVIYMDVDLNRSQTGCAPDARDAEGYLPAADCVGIQGGGVSGRTELRVFDIVPDDQGGYHTDGIVLVDMAGAELADIDPQAFFLSTDTANYVDLGLGGIEKGMFLYVLEFDEDARQFTMFSAPSAGALQFPMLATAANQLWRTATGGWFDRRVRQRDVEREEGLGTGAWVNLTGVNSTRDVASATSWGVGQTAFDNSYDQKDVALSFGWDLINHSIGASSWNLGATVGYAQSEITFEGDNDANLEGVHGGAYGGWSMGAFFVDAALSGAKLSLHNDVPALNLIPTGTLLDTDVTSLGGRIEAGWRWTMGSLSVEPLAGFSAVRTEFDDLRVPNGDPDTDRPGVTLRLDSAESRRASAGVRVGLEDLWADVAPTSFSFAARLVNEFEGEAGVSVLNFGETLTVGDVLDGTFTQLTASAGVTNASKTIGGYLNVDTTLGDDYESFGLSAGLRLQW